MAFLFETLILSILHDAQEEESSQSKNYTKINIQSNNFPFVIQISIAKYFTYPFTLNKKNYFYEIGFREPNFFDSLYDTNDYLPMK